MDNDIFFTFLIFLIHILKMNINLEPIFLRKKVSKAITKQINVLLKDPNFLRLKHKLQSKFSIRRLTKFLLYYNNYVNENIMNNPVYISTGAYYQLQIVFTDDNSNPILYQQLIKPYNSHKLLNSLDGKTLDEVYQTTRNFQLLPYQKLIITDVISNKSRCWQTISKDNNSFMCRYTPGSASVSYIPSSYDMLSTSAQPFTPDLSSGENAIVISTCGAGGNSVNPNGVATGGAGSGGYISVIIPTSFTYNGVTYTLAAEDGVVYTNNGTIYYITFITFAASNGDTFKIQLIPGNGLNVNQGQESSPGGQSSIIVSDTSIPRSSYFLSEIVVPGSSGVPYSNGTVQGSYNGYTEGGAGVNTANYTELNVTNQPDQTGMMLSGSTHHVNSQAASTTSPPLGYGYGGSADPSGLYTSGGSGFIEVMSVILD